MIGVVVGQQQGFSKDSLAIARGNSGEQICLRIFHELLHCLEALAEFLHTGVPGGSSRRSVRFSANSLQAISGKHVSNYGWRRGCPIARCASVRAASRANAVSRQVFARGSLAECLRRSPRTWRKRRLLRANKEPAHAAPCPLFFPQFWSVFTVPDSSP